MAVVVPVSRLPAVDWLEDEQFCLQREVKLARLILRLKQCLQLLLEVLSGVAVHVHTDVRQRLQQFNSLFGIAHGKWVRVHRVVYQLKQAACITQ